MAEKLSIEISENGSRTVKRSIKDIGETARSVGSPVEQLRDSINKLTTVANRINQTLQKMSQSMLANARGASANAAAVDKLAVAELKAATAAATAATAQAREAATAATLAASLATATGATLAHTAATGAMAAANTVASTALVATTGASAAAATSVVALSTAQARGVATANQLAAANSQLGSSLKALPARVDVFAQAAEFIKGAGGAGGGGGGGIGAVLGGIGDGFRKVGSAAGGLFAAGLAKARAAIASTVAALFTLRSAIAGSVAALVAFALGKLTDQYTVMQNRINLTASSQENANAVFKELLAISQETRSALAGNVELYSRLAVSSKELGVSQQELLNFTKSLNQAVKLSGATAIEAENAIRQLSQGLASGTLRGDELRSVLEQLPAVADIIAKGLGVTRGELRKLGEDGKITAGQILKAFREARGELEGNFGKAVPTLAEGFVVLKNQLVDTIGQLFNAADGSNVLGTAFGAVLNWLVKITPELVNFTRALAGSLDQQDQLSNGSKVFATILITAAGAVKLLAKSLISILGTAFRVVGRTIGGVVAAVAALLRGEFAEAGTILKETFKDNAADIVDTSRDLSQELVDSASGTVEKLVKVWDSGARQVQDRAKLAVGGVEQSPRGAARTPVDAEALKEREKLLKRTRDSLQSLLGSIDPVTAAVNEQREAEQLLAKAQELNIVTAAERARLTPLLASHYQDLVDPLGRVNRELEQETTLLALGNREREVEAALLSITEQLRGEGRRLTEQETAALRQRLTSMQALNEATRLQNDLLEGSVEQRRQFVEGLEAMQTLLANPASGFTRGDATSALSDQLGLSLDNTQEMFAAEVERHRLMYDQIEALRQKDLINEQTAAALRAQVWAKTQELNFRAASDFFGNLSVLQKSKSKELAKIGKAAAVSRAIIDTYSSANAAYASMAGIPVIGPALGAAAAAAAVAAGLANVQAIRSQPAGFMAGGYTGGSSSREVRGAVHGKEFVMNAAATRRIGVDNLERMNAGAPSRGQVKVSIQNYGTSKKFEVKQLSENEVRVIARDEVLATAPEVVAGQLDNANSTVSRALVRNTKTVRAR